MIYGTRDNTLLERAIEIVQELEDERKHGDRPLRPDTLVQYLQAIALVGILSELGRLNFIGIHQQSR
jgi:hypothetical protein